MNQPMSLIGEAIAQAAAIAGIGFTIWFAIELVRCVRWYDENVD